jgi:hypothetical protein
MNLLYMIYKGKGEMKDPASILFNDTHGGAKQEECE